MGPYKLLFTLVSLLLVEAHIVHAAPSAPSQLVWNTTEFGRIEMVKIGTFSRPNADGKDQEHYWFTTTTLLVADNANKVCAATIGGKAASFKDVATNTAAKIFLSSHDISAAWTSGADFEENGKFVWRQEIGSDIPFTFFDFHHEPGFPNPDCQCVSIELIKGPGCGNVCKGQYKWRERPCSEKKRLLCEL